MRVTAFARCAWCRSLKLPQFYRGKRVNRCECDHDYRSPIEVRRDAVLEKYGSDPDAYTPAVLKELADQGLLNLTEAFCPAGRLSMEEAKEREAQGIEAGTATDSEAGVAGGESPVAESDAPNHSPSPNGEATQ